MLKFIDTSHWESKFNFSEAKADGCTGMMTKASEGDGNLDPTCANLIAEAKAQGLVTGMYHFFHASKSVDAQVKLFCGQYEKIKTDMRPIIDFESASGDGLNISAIKVAAWAWIQEVEARLKRPVMVYGGESFLNSLKLGPEWAKHALWLADYTRPEVPAPWTAYTFWQYTDAGEQHADTNWFNGNAQDLAKFLAG